MWARRKWWLQVDALQALYRFDGSPSTTTGCFSGRIGPDVCFIRAFSPYLSIAYSASSFHFLCWASHAIGWRRDRGRVDQSSSSTEYVCPQGIYYSKYRFDRYEHFFQSFSSSPRLTHTLPRECDSGPVVYRCSKEDNFSMGHWQSEEEKREDQRARTHTAESVVNQWLGREWCLRRAIQVRSCQ